MRRGLPGDAGDTQARYLEVDVPGLRVASVYLPNGNPQPGPKFDYKLAWFERLIAHARTLIDSGRDVVLAGDFNVVPTDADIYNAWLVALRRRPPARDAGVARTPARRRAGSMRRVISTRTSASTPSGSTTNAFRRNAGFRMDFLLLTPALAKRLTRAEVDVEQRGRERPSDHAPVWIELGPTRGIVAP